MALALRRRVQRLCARDALPKSGNRCRRLLPLRYADEPCGENINHPFFSAGADTSKLDTVQTVLREPGQSGRESCVATRPTVGCGRMCTTCRVFPRIDWGSNYHSQKAPWVRGLL